MSEQIWEINWTILNTTNGMVKKKQNATAGPLSCWNGRERGQTPTLSPPSHQKGSSGLGPSQMAHLCQEPGSSITTDGLSAARYSPWHRIRQCWVKTTSFRRLQNLHFLPDAITVMSSWKCEMQWESPSSPGFSGWLGQWFTGCPWKSQLSLGCLGFLSCTIQSCT